MLRQPYLPLCAAGIVAVCGCAHFVESRAIQRFSHALQQQDLHALRESTSETFDRKALRLAESLDDLQILSLPTGDLSVVKVEDVSDNEKNVTVQVGESNRRLLYKLTKHVQTGQWLVDDIYMKQKKQNLTAVRSVSDQMDLLLSVREFLSAWQEGSRSDVLRVTTPEFGGTLAQLPPGYLAQLTQRMVREPLRGRRQHPQAQLDEGVAVVRLPRGSGEMVLSFRMQADAWRVDDIEIQSRDEEQRVPSVRREAEILFSGLAFLDAYQAADKQALAQTCTPRFFEALAPADLSAVPLPELRDLQPDYRVKDLGGEATLAVPAAGGLVRLRLSRQRDESSPREADRYLVDDVTTFGREGGEQQLSAVFTATAVAQLFAQALADGDLPLLRRLSTPHFAAATWERVDDAMLRVLPLQGFRTAAPRVTGVQYRGEVTEIAAEQFGAPVTFVLRNWNGKLRVDDVWTPLPRRPKSMKETLSALIPVYAFAGALERENVEVLQRQSSSEFDRLVWKQVRSFPNVGVVPFQQFQAPVQAVLFDNDRATVKLGDDRFGAEVTLLREYEQWVVDEVLLIAGPEPSQRHELRKALKQELARNFQQLRRGSGDGRAFPQALVPGGARGFGGEVAEERSHTVPVFLSGTSGKSASRPEGPADHDAELPPRQNPEPAEDSFDVPPMRYRR